ncbi:MAG: hypothetical protein ACHQX3_07360, partial [Nitrospirales bacterium]
LFHNPGQLEKYTIFHPGEGSFTKQELIYDSSDRLTQETVHERGLGQVKKWVTNYDASGLPVSTFIYVADLAASSLEFVYTYYDK